MGTKYPKRLNGSQEIEKHKKVTIHKNGQKISQNSRLRRMRSVNL